MQPSKFSITKSYAFCFLAIILCASSLKEQPPANDDKTNAIDLSSIIDGAQTQYSNEHATTDVALNTNLKFNVWFKFSAPQSGEITIDFLRPDNTGSSISSGIMELRDNIGNLVGKANLANQNDGYISVDNLNPQQEYFLVVGTSSSSTSPNGYFDLKLSDEVNFDFKIGAIDVTQKIDDTITHTYSNEHGTTDNSGNTNMRWNVWFKFTAPLSGTITADFSRTSIPNYLSAGYLAILDDQGNWLKSLSLGSNAEGDLSLDGLVSNDTYFITVGTSSTNASAKGSFDLSLSSSPGSDLRAGAEDVSVYMNGCSSDAQFNNDWSTTDNGFTAFNHNMWLKFQAPSSGEVKVQVLLTNGKGTLRDAAMLLQEANGTLVASANAGLGGGSMEVYASGLTAGQEYFLSVGSNTAHESYKGSFTLCLQDQMQPTNDDRANAKELILDIDGNYASACSEFTTEWATPDGTSFTGWHSGVDGNVWFKFKATATGEISIKVLRGYNGYGSASYVEMGLENASGTKLASEGAGVAVVNNGISATGLVDGEYYYFTVDNRFTNGVGTFTIKIEDDLNYDQRSEAHLISFDANGEYRSAKEEFTTVGATGDGPIFSGWSSAPSSNVWFKFQATSSGKVLIRALRGYDDYGTASYIQMGLEDNAGNPLASDGAGVAMVNNGLVADNLTPGATYYLTVDTRAVGDKTGTFTLQAEDYWSYDQRSEAHLISFDNNGEYSSAKEEFTTEGATGDGAIFSGWSSAPSSNVWFKFQATSSGKVLIKALRGYDGYGTGSYIQMGLEDAAGNPLASDGAGVAMVNNGMIADNLTPGDTYFITVDNRVIGDKTGTFTLQAQDYWTYDQQESALDLPLDAGGDFESDDAQFTTVGATGDGPRFSTWPTSPSSNVWFKMSFQFNGDITIDVKRGGDFGDGSYFQTGLLDSNGNMLTSIGANASYSLVTISAQNLVAGESYYLSVDSRNLGNRTGSFSLEVDFSPTLTCETQLWAIASGSWDSPGIWSDTEGGQPVAAIPCATTEVFIKGFDVSFNSTGIETAKRVEIIGTNINTLTRLNVQTGQLNVEEEVVTSGAGARLRNANGARIKVTGQ